MIDESSEEKEWSRILRQTWITSALEKDKVLIMLSSAGLGFLITVLTKSAPLGCVQKGFLFIGLIGFTAAIVGGIGSLEANQRIILRELKREPETKKPISDIIMKWGFMAGIGCTCLMGLSIIFPMQFHR